MSKIEIKTINYFYEDDIARYLVKENIKESKNININNLIKFLLGRNNINLNTIDIVDFTKEETEEIKKLVEEVLAEIDNYKETYKL